MKGELRSIVGRRYASTYAFIGLGKMGYPMSRNLRASLPSSTSFMVYDTNAAACEEFKRDVKHVTIAKDLHEIGQHANVILTMLPNSNHVEECYDALKLPVNPQRLLLDCSTIDPFRSSRIADKFKECGTFVDAPVSGGVSGATKGTLSFMIGMSRNDPLAGQVEAELSKMGKTFHFCGSNGSGLAAKLSNNYLLALNNLATCEAMMLGLSMGLESDILGKVINSSTGRCWPSLSNNPVVGVTEGAPAEKGYAGGFGIELMIKDLGLAIEAAKNAGIVLPGADEALQRYQTVAKDERYKNKDFGVVYQYLKDLQR